LNLTDDVKEKISMITDQPTSKDVHDIFSSKQTRLEQANRFIEAVANNGRKFFRNGPRLAVFVFAEAGRVAYIDNYTKASIYTDQPHGARWDRFSHGSTLKDLVLSVGKYINTGEPAELNLGPWRENFDLWGYGEDMSIVRDAARTNGLTNACVDSEEQTASPSTSEAPKG
jgi:hypothetical protein